MKSKKSSRKLSAKDVQADHKALLANEEMLQVLIKERCFTLKEIKKRKIGWIEQDGFSWYSFPVQKKHGSYAFKKLKRPPKAPKTQQKGMVYPKNSQSTLYPLDSYDPEEDRIILCAGEPDTIAARSIGLPAICGTAGEQTFKEEWVEFLKKGIPSKKLFVFLDNDETGKKATDKLCQDFSRHCFEWEIYLVKWPDGFPEKGDVTDFIRQYEGKDVATALLELTERYSPPSRQDQLKESLRRSGSEKTILPLQAFHEGVGYYSVPLMQEGQPELFTITSKRECFPCNQEEFLKKGLRVLRFPLNDQRMRWPQEQLLDFLDGAEAFSIGDIHHLITEKLKEYAEIKDSRYYDCIALWILATYFYQFFHSFPYLHIYGIYKSGKTKMLQIGVLLSFNGELLTNPTVAALVRLIHNNGVTCGIDEAERLENARDETTAVLQEILRVGYKRGGSMPRCEKSEDGQQQVICYDTYSPKILTGTEPLDKALASRCIQLLMLRSRNPKVANKEINFSSLEWPELRGLIYPAALCAFDEVQSTLATITLEELVGREAEIWRPLLVVAKAADKSGALFERMYAFALEIQQKIHAEEEDWAIPKFIQCLMDQLPQDDFITVENLADGLVKFDDEFHWLNEPKYKISGRRWINKTLTQLGLWNGPATLRSIQGEKKRGYELKRAKIIEAADRYGVSDEPSESVTSVTNPEEEPP
ncbi:MAG: hypothetical protein PHX87_02575 [Candidatus Peribacteraceae bacterium]|nr:hypothetical protein [Candidatus Peribacteraceae bacterium]